MQKSLIDNKKFLALITPMHYFLFPWEGFLENPLPGIKLLPDYEVGNTHL